MSDGSGFGFSSGPEAILQTLLNLTSNNNMLYSSRYACPLVQEKVFHSVCLMMIVLVILNIFTHCR